jgi:hypothetical protein
MPLNYTLKSVKEEYFMLSVKCILTTIKEKQKPGAGGSRL